VLALLTPAGGEPLAEFIRRTVDPDRLHQALIKGAGAERRPVDDPLPDLPYSSESSQIIEGAHTVTSSCECVLRAGMAPGTVSGDGDRDGGYATASSSVIENRQLPGARGPLRGTLNPDAGRIQDVSPFR
jgi:hypothetical protein